MTFTPDDIVVSRASYAKDPDAAPRSVVTEVYPDGRFERFCPRYLRYYIVERPEGWLKVGRRPLACTPPGPAGGWDGR